MAIGVGPLEQAKDHQDLIILRNSDFLNEPAFLNYEDDWIKHIIKRTLVVKQEDRMTMEELCQYVADREYSNSLL